MRLGGDGSKTAQRSSPDATVAISETLRQIEAQPSSSVMQGITIIIQ